ncbi:MAG: Smr/MutS family protein [Verrucomicrobiota bacterium]
MRNGAGGPRDKGEGEGQSGDDDRAAFNESIAGVRRLAGPQRVPAGAAIPALEAARPRVPSGVDTGAAVAGARLAVEETGASWSARADGVSARILRRLRGGVLPVETHVDLHGLTRGPAAAALERFVTAAHQAGRRSLLVIHGRGLHSGPEGPALRDLVRDHLTVGPLAARVLACGSASPAHGGAGATVLYLRR